jgi:hypothetical protein
MNGSWEHLSWRRVRRCGTSSCVEIAHDLEVIHMRDSKDPDGPVLTFSHEVWNGFLADLRDDSRR